MNFKINKNNHLAIEVSFNEQCYKLLSQIPMGRITTYKAIAEALNCKAYQAVGNAMNKNPNPIEVPCHRVINSNGHLGGYAFGKNRKIELLNIEGIVIENDKVRDFKKLLYDFKKE